MLSKVLKLILIFSFLIFFFACSLDNKTGIWNNKQKKNTTEDKLKKLSAVQDNFDKEINPELKINFISKAKKNNKWIMPGSNYSNLTYHLKFEGQTNKFSKYKYKRIKYKITKDIPLILEKNYVITIDSKGSILKFSNKKRLQWIRNVYTKKEKKKITHISLALFKHILYAIDNLGKYYALDLDTGKIIWVNQHRTAFHSQIKVYKNKIFAVDSSNVMNCFSTIDGTEIWKYKTNPTFIKTNKKLSIITTPDSVLFSNTAGDIAKLKINTGELIWFMPTQNTLVQHETNFLETSDIVLSKKNLFFSNNFSNMFSLNVNSGIINWILNINSNLRPILIDNYLFTISQKGYLLVIDSTEGKTIRSTYILDMFQPKQRKKLFMQGFLIASNKIYITTNLGYLIVCSVDSGKAEKVFRISKSQLSEPFISNNNLYILNDKSVIVF